MTRPAIDAIATAGAQKDLCARQAPLRYLSRSAFAGACIFIGALISCLCGAWFYESALPVAKLLGAATFATALILIVLLGGELFTGCNLVMGVTLYEGKVSPAGALRVWAMAYIGNFIGIIVLCILLVGSTASGELLAAYLAILVPGKLAGPWYVLLLKGVMCNFLVCVGVFAGFRMQSESGKAIVITLAITTFVLTGLEHSVANMAYFSLYCLMVSTDLLPGMGWNMLWVTIGNLLGGAVLLGLPIWYAADPKREG